MISDDRSKKHLHAISGLADGVALLKRLPIDRLDAGGQVVLPPVPRARDAAVPDKPLGERAALVGAHRVDGIPVSLMPKHGDDALADQRLECEIFGTAEAPG